jgi:hypothetical protein
VWQVSSPVTGVPAHSRLLLDTYMPACMHRIYLPSFDELSRPEGPPLHKDNTRDSSTHPRHTCMHSFLIVLFKQSFSRGVGWAARVCASALRCEADISSDLRGGGGDAKGLGEGGVGRTWHA